MADLRRPIEIWLDVENSARKKLVTAGSLAEPDSLTLFRGTQLCFRCHLLMSDGVTYYHPAETDTWLFGIDDVYTRDHVDLVTTLNVDFNKDGDWENRDIVGGKICWRVDLSALSLKEALADSEVKPMYCALWVCPLGGKYTLLGHWGITMHNVAVDPTTAVVQEGITFATMDVLIAWMNDIKNPLNGLYRFKNGALQLKNSTTSKFQTKSISGEEGAESEEYGPGED